MTQIRAETPFLDALSADERLYDRYVAANAFFRRLASAVMREDTAGRLSVAEVASMGGIAVADVLPEVTDSNTAVVPLGEDAPAQLADTIAPTLDVRPLLAKGHEPLPGILDFVAGLPAGSPFAIEASFEPKPLRRLFAVRGYESAAKLIGENHWRVVFRRVPAG